MEMIVDAYQQILRNVEIQAEKPRKSPKTKRDNVGSGWFAQYAPALSGFLPEAARATGRDAV